MSNKLNEWVGVINSFEFKKILEFVEQTKNKQKIQNKCLYLVGNVQKAIKLIIDIENMIGVDDCEYIKIKHLKDIFINDNIYEYKLNNHYIDCKCLTIEVGDNIEKFSELDFIIKDMFNNTHIQFNTIVVGEKIPIELSLLARCIVVNI